LEAGSLKLKRDLYDLSEVIGVARIQLRKRMHDRQIIIQLADNLPMIRVDITLFAQVFVNLLDNALKYSPDASPIEITACQIDNELEIRVGDQGRGIPADDVPYIFNKFYRASNIGSSTGSGLGLSICQGIVEAHHGKITVQQRSEGGTWFIIRLPLTGENDIYA
jgi:two-component system sensor histidine kinase KdpD